MAEYIEREKIYADISRLLIDKSTADLTNCEDGWTSAISEAMDVIKNAPAADVRPERHGRWSPNALETDDYWAAWFECSLCGYRLDDDDYMDVFHYCPNCGAKMGGKDGESDG